MILALMRICGVFRSRLATKRLTSSTRLRVSVTMRLLEAESAITRPRPLVSRVSTDLVICPSGV